MEEISSLLYSHNISFTTIGHTSNMWFKNDLNIDCILDTRQLKGFYETDNNQVVCDCGLPIKQLSRYCIEHGYAGYEGLINLPGTVAGAIVNNSSCYKCGVQSTLDSIDLITEDGNLKHLPASELGYSFRNFKFKDGSLRGVIVRAYFDTSRHESPSVLQSRAEACHRDRLITQDPAAHNLGSTVNVSHIRKTPLGILFFLFLMCRKSSRTMQKTSIASGIESSVVYVEIPRPLTIFQTKEQHVISGKMQMLIVVLIAIYR